LNQQYLTLRLLIPHNWHLMNNAPIVGVGGLGAQPTGNLGFVVLGDTVDASWDDID
jgi:hypothetical protein